MIKLRKLEFYILVVAFTVLGLIFTALLLFLFPSITEKLRKESISMLTDEITYQLSHIERDLIKVSEGKLFEFLTSNSNWKWFFEKRLETLLTKHIENAYLITKVNNDYVYLLFSNVGELKISPLELNTNHRKELDMVFNERKVLLVDRVAYVSLLKPIIYNGKVIGILGVDFSPVKFKEVERHIFLVKLSLLSLSVLLFSLIALLIFATVRSGLIETKLYTDSLTGVLSRSALNPLLNSIDLKNYGLILIDIDNFKIINDTYGHKVGDVVLKIISQRLKNTIRKNKDFLIRYGGEEFLALIRIENSEDEVIKVAEKLRRAVASSPVSVQGRLLRVTVSIGVLPNLGKERNIEEAIRKADVALYRAKRKGKNRVEVFTENVDKISLSFLQASYAIEQNKILIYLQPVYNLLDGEIVLFEALTRLKSDNGSVFSPQSFIPSIRKTETYKIFTKKLLLSIARILDKNKDLNISVNVEVSQLLDEDMITFIKDYFGNKKEIAKRMYVEILEYEEYEYGEKKTLIDKLLRLRELGLSFIIDDFGTGYSNLLRIADLPVDYVKISGEIIENIQNPRMKSLCKAVQSFCGDLGIGVIAEHVSSHRILKEVLSTGIKYGQGFYLGEPKPVEYWLNHIQVKEKS